MCRYSHGPHIRRPQQAARSRSANHSNSKRKSTLHIVTDRGCQPINVSFTIHVYEAKREAHACGGQIATSTMHHTIDRGSPQQTEVQNAVRTIVACEMCVLSPRCLSMIQQHIHDQQTTTRPTRPDHHRHTSAQTKVIGRISSVWCDGRAPASDANSSTPSLHTVVSFIFHVAIKQPATRSVQLDSSNERCRQRNEKRHEPHARLRNTSMEGRCDFQVHSSVDFSCSRFSIGNHATNATAH